MVDEETVAEGEDPPRRRRRHRKKEDETVLPPLRVPASAQNLRKELQEAEEQPIGDEIKGRRRRRKDPAYSASQQKSDSEDHHASVEVQDKTGNGSQLPPGDESGLGLDGAKSSVSGGEGNHTTADDMPNNMRSTKLEVNDEVLFPTGKHTVGELEGEEQEDPTGTVENENSRETNRPKKANDTVTEESTVDTDHSWDRPKLKEEDGAETELTSGGEPSGEVVISVDQSKTVESVSNVDSGVRRGGLSDLDLPTCQTLCKIGHSRTGGAMCRRMVLGILVAVIALTIKFSTD